MYENQKNDFFRQTFIEDGITTIPHLKNYVDIEKNIRLQEDWETGDLNCNLDKDKKTGSGVWSQNS